MTPSAGPTALLALGAYLALGGELGAAEVLAILVLAARCADPRLSLADIGGKLRGARAELSRLDAILRTEPLPEPGEPLQPVRHGVGVRLGHLPAGRPYRDRRPDVVRTGRKAPGDRRPVGAGKSTLLRLLARFHDVDAGAVRVGGVDFRAMATDDLMARIAIVFQDVYLFDGTIEENVRLGRPGASEAEVRAAASAARLEEVIERLVGARRRGLLSGGERQRVAIARALLKDAPIVLLDEVTSALDPVNEAAVHEGIERLMAGGRW